MGFTAALARFITFRVIEVENLTKRYAGFTAVDTLNFRVEKGEVVGFLGPNGAGKSTTMRMLAGYLPPTSGTARVAGHDVFEDSLAAREQIGYMPENVPLYQEMRVREYLKYRAALKGVRGRRIRGRLEDVMELCGLVEARDKLIGNLSKGFRQRVGLADAMIHEPELLLLDEPTIGLDPNQIRHVRELIGDLSRHHTILISTHILSEVEMTCGRVIILNGGRIAAVDTPQNLRRKIHQSCSIVVELSQAPARDAGKILADFPAFKEVRHDTTGDGWERFEMDVLESFEGDPRPALYELCREKGWVLRELSRRAVSLEDVFAEITTHPES